MVGFAKGFGRFRYDFIVGDDLQDRPQPSYWWLAVGRGSRWPASAVASCWHPPSLSASPRDHTAILIDVPAP